MALKYFLLFLISINNFWSVPATSTTTPIFFTGIIPILLSEPIILIQPAAETTSSVDEYSPPILADPLNQQDRKCKKRIIRRRNDLRLFQKE
jgi:hypothetical protein